MHNGFISGRSLVSLDSCYEGFQGPYRSLVPRQRLQHRLLVAVAEGYVRLRSDRNPACTTASFADAASFHSTAATRVFKAHIAASCLVSDYNSAFRSSCRRLRPVAQRPYSGVHDGFGSGRSLVSLDSCYEGFQSPYRSLVPRQRLQLRFS